MGEGDAQTVNAKRPVEGVGGGFKGCQKCDGGGERRKLKRGDRGEASVVEGATYGKVTY